MDYLIDLSSGCDLQGGARSTVLMAPLRLKDIPLTVAEGPRPQGNASVEDRQKARHYSAVNIAFARLRDGSPHDVCAQVRDGRLVAGAPQLLRCDGG